MSKWMVTIVAGLFATAAVFGAIAVTHTVSLGAANTHKTDASVLARAKQLSRFEASLRKALAKTPPALPAIPKTVAAAPQAGTPPAAAPQPRVIYQRPPAIVIVRHLHHGDDGSREAADGGGGGD
jgi:hypothetical protein